MGLLQRRRSGVHGDAADHLDEVRAELARVRLELQRATTSLDNLPVGVVLVDAEGAVVLRNARSHLASGHAQVLVQEAVDRHVQAALRGRESHSSVELFGPPRSVIQVTATPLDEGGAIVAIEDISERARLDAVRTDFVANISHELKTPVGALAVLAEAIADEDDIAIVQRLSGKMVDEAHRAATVIEDLLELSRIELGGMAVRDPVDVGTVMRDAVVRTLAAAEQRTIRIDLDDPSDKITVLGDRRQLVSASTGSSSASTASTGLAAVRPAAPASASRSCATSPPTTKERYSCSRPKAKEAPSRCGSRWRHDRRHARRAARRGRGELRRRAADRPQARGLPRRGGT
ncbi:MAG: PAS domain-containing protein [Actinobacteria bacterium]|nr:PAS domain-containing protein [Actinomycetota bacterium]